MLKLKAFRTQAKGLTDFLQPACMLDEFTLLLKNGSLMTSFAYAGRDIESATNDELNALAYASDHVLAQLGSCLLYTSPSPRDQRGSRMPSSA